MRIKDFAVISIILCMVFAGCTKKLQLVERKDTQPVQSDSLKDLEVSAGGEIGTSLDDSDIIRDPDGQWAIDAEASSSYAGTKKGMKNEKWSPAQLTGPPDVEQYGDDPKAWAAESEKNKNEWIRLKYENPVYASEIRIRENYNPGAIAKVELIDASGNSHIVWEGKDTTTRGNQVRYFIVRFEKTKYKTNEIKITLSPTTAAGWTEIDAVQLVGKQY